VTDAAGVVVGHGAGALGPLSEASLYRVPGFLGRQSAGQGGFDQGVLGLAGVQQSTADQTTDAVCLPVRHLVALPLLGRLHGRNCPIQGCPSVASSSFVGVHRLTLPETTLS